MAGLVPATQKRRRCLAIPDGEAAGRSRPLAFLGSRDKPGHDVLLVVVTAVAKPLSLSSNPTAIRGSERRMPIAAARVYSDGHRLRSLWLHDPEDRPVQAHQFTWIGLVDPDAEELAVLQARFGLRPLAVEDVLTDHPIPK